MSNLLSNKSIICKSILNGSIVYMPTDTIPGLVCSALNKDSVENIFILKKREFSKPPTIIISMIEQLSLLGVSPPPEEIIKKYWPGSVSIVLSVNDNSIDKLTYLHRGVNSLAIRLTNSTELANIINITGPLATSSANIQGKEPAQSVNEAKKYFGGSIDLYIEPDTNFAKASSIIRINPDASVDKLR